jgi:tRNA threonylcarbamoyladenosine biosynthesis protein TsaE
MSNYEYISHSPSDTLKLGEKIGRNLRNGSVIALIGELGCGKTLLTRGITTGLGVPMRQVNSPTFVLVNEYRGRRPVFHMDLYRLGDAADVVDIGLLDYLARAESGVIIIEWAEKILSLLPDEYLKIEFEIISARKRRISFSAAGEIYNDLMEKINKP